MVGIDKATIIFVVCASSISFPFDSFYFLLISPVMRYLCVFFPSMARYLATSAHQRLRWVLEATGSRKVELVEFVGRPDG